MRILISTPGFPPAYLGGGPIRSISAMLTRADPRHDVWVLTNNFDHGSTAPLVEAGNRWLRHKNAQVLYVNPGFRSLVSGLVQSLKKTPDCIYVNSLFYPRLSLTFFMLPSRMKNALMVVAPRGELDPGALALKSGKKRLFLSAFKALGLHRKVIWHASTPMEERNIRQVMGCGADVIVHENDTDLPITADRSLFTHSPSIRLVFLSRLSPKKGLHTVIKALQFAKEEIQFDVIGPEEDPAYVQHCRRLATEAPANVTIRFKGAIPPQDTRLELSRYDALVFPTEGENFGHVIAEALSVGCPVICSDTTPWSSRLRKGAGVVVESQHPPDWSRAIDTYARAGRQVWRDRKVKAADAYDAWMAEKSDDHLFDMLDSRTSTAVMK